MTTALKLKVNIGERQFVVDCTKYSYERALKLAEGLAEVRRKNSILAKYPMEEGETAEKWNERVGPLLSKERARQEGESAEDHLKRIIDSKVESHEMAFDALNLIAEVFNIRPVEDDEFRQANWLEVKSFIYDVFNMGDIPADEFFPKRPTS